MDKIVLMNASEWEKYANEAHLLSFSVDRPSSFDRTNFAIMYVHDEVPYSFMSCHEMDEETCYIQWGGSFKPEEKKVFAMRAYVKMLGFLCEKYKRLTTSIENTNTEMLKPAMKAGFRIVGVRVGAGKVFLEHVLELGVQYGR